MKFFSNESTFLFTWEQVVAAFWQRYPNPQSKHVLTEDVIERKLDGDRLITKRLISKKGALPKWGERFVRGMHKYMYIVEESVVDLRTKTFTTYTRNITHQRVSRVDEKCIYTQHPETGRSTLCTRYGWVNSSINGFSSLISSFVMKGFQKSVKKTVIGYEHVLNKLYTPETNIPEKMATGTIKEKAKEFAKTKADSMKSKVPRPRTATCES